MRPSILCLCAASLIVCVGASINAPAAEPSPRTEDPAPPPYRPWTVALEAGTTGFGASGSWRFSDHLGLRLGGDYLEVSRGGTEIKHVEYNLKARVLSESLIADVYPWQRSSFHVGIGVMFNQNELTGDATSAGTQVIFPTARGNTLSMKMEQQPVNPYLGIGGNLFYFDRAHRWALAGELGVAYTGEPKVSLTWSGYSGPLVDTAVRDHKNALQDYADQFVFWPVIKLYVSYSF